MWYFRKVIIPCLICYKIFWSMKNIKRFIRLRLKLLAAKIQPVPKSQVQEKEQISQLYHQMIYLAKQTKGIHNHHYIVSKKISTKRWVQFTKAENSLCETPLIRIQRKNLIHLIWIQINLIGFKVQELVKIHQGKCLWRAKGILIKMKIHSDNNNCRD